MNSDDPLIQLALHAQKSPPRSREQRRALTELVEKLRRPGCLSRPLSEKFSSQVYQEIYLIALSDLSLYIFNNIDKYNPKRASITTWVNYLLKKRFINKAIKEVMGEPEIEEVEYKDQLEHNFSDNSDRSLLDLVIEFVQEDADKAFESLYVSGCPQANFKTIFLSRFVEKKSWQEISTELHKQPSTLSSFYQRTLKKLAPIIKETVQNQN